MIGIKAMHYKTASRQSHSSSLINAIVRIRVWFAIDKSARRTHSLVLGRTVVYTPLGCQVSSPRHFVALKHRCYHLPKHFSSRPHNTPLLALSSPYTPSSDTSQDRLLELANNKKYTTSHKNARRKNCPE